ncbi:MAG: serine hydrolase [Spirochaetales bacterium]|nr:serine hydrolase [Spirochaetales bacterium]
MRNKYIVRIKSLVVFSLIVLLSTSSCSKSHDDAMLEISEYAKQIGTAAVLVLKDGKTLYSYGDLEFKYMCHSIRKPFLGALYGIYVDRRIIDLDLTLEELGIDDIEPALTADEKQATIRDLLMSRSGVYHEAGGEAPSMIAARPERGSHTPGSFFYYNNWDFNALGTIFTKLTGKGVFEAFDEELARRIGMKDFSIEDCSYIYENDKSRHPSYFFRMSTRDMALFGRLYQQLGRWKGRQIVPEAWIRESTAVYPVGNPGGDPYGYLWRIIPEEAGLGYGFYHTGLGVHLLGVLPDQKLVVVHRVDTDKPYKIKWSEIKKLLEMIVAAP